MFSVKENAPMKVKFTHTSYRQPMQKAHHKFDKFIQNNVSRTKEVQMSGSKGGRVERQRREAREVDQELRNYSYR